MTLSSIATSDTNQNSYNATFFVIVQPDNDVNAIPKYVFLLTWWH